jgi:hypothetical protein
MGVDNDRGAAVDRAPDGAEAEGRTDGFSKWECQAKVQSKCDVSPGAQCKTGSVPRTSCSLTCVHQVLCYNANV